MSIFLSELVPHRYLEVFDLSYIIMITELHILKSKVNWYAYYTMRLLFVKLEELHIVIARKPRIHQN